MKPYLNTKFGFKKWTPHVKIHFRTAYSVYYLETMNDTDNQIWKHIGYSVQIGRNEWFGYDLNFKPIPMNCYLTRLSCAAVMTRFRQ